VFLRTKNGYTRASDRMGIQVWKLTTNLS
jgi:hypothetical protein